MVNHNALARLSLLAAAAAWPALGSQSAKTPLKPAGGSFAPPLESRPAVILDPGHGGSDLGAVIKGRREKDICLSVALKLQKSLDRPGGPGAILTRRSDVYIPLDRRVAAGSSRDSAVFLSLHANETRDRKERGIMVYSFGHSWKAPKSRRLRVPPLPSPSDEAAREGAILADMIARSLKAGGFRVSGVARTDYYVLKNPNHPSVLVELGFLSNPKERRSLGDPAYQKRLADTLARGLAAYLARQNRRQWTASAAR